MGSTKMEDFINRVIRGDAIEVISQIPDGSIDMTFADPSFNLEKNKFRDNKS